MDPITDDYIRRNTTASQFAVTVQKLVRDANYHHDASYADGMTEHVRQDHRRLEQSALYMLCGAAERLADLTLTSEPDDQETERSAPVPDCQHLYH